ncbi:MAG: discoidin domain-containing protein, partial [Armatimonadota bacterium]|nr:discoidin domain-containing protein [Armatimonadota bacterium]
TGESSADLKLVDEVNGSYEVLAKVTLLGKAAAADAQLKDIEFETTTMLNAKTQPKLNVGKNTIYVGTGEQTGSIVFWPELQGENAKPYIVEQQNVTFKPEHPGYLGTLHATKANQDAYVVFKMDAPGDITRLTYGGRLYNRAPKSHIDFLHSFDGGKTWTKSYSLTDIKPPWDIIHYVTVDQVPAGTRSVLFKYLLNGSEVGGSACSIYAVRMEANHKTADATFKPLEVTFNWSERQKDYSLVERSHTELVTKVPYKYTINIGGEDHPIVNSLRINLQGAVLDVKPGYSDGKDVGGEKFVPRWATYGKNLAGGKSYTVSLPSETTWDAGDPDGKKLTDGIVGPSFAGGTSYKYGAMWSAKKNPVITLDLGAPASCASFGLNFHGYPWHDALKGQVKDQVEVLVSDDGKDFNSLGFLQTDLRYKDIPINFMLPDEETLTGATFRFIPDKPVTTRYVQYKITNKRNFDVTELEVLDAIKFEPYDLRLALPDEKAIDGGVKPQVLSAAGRPMPAEQAAKNAAKSMGDPALDAPTMHSLGTYWIVGGDDNKDAKIEVAYRKIETVGSSGASRVNGAGAPTTSEWKPGPALFRVEQGAHQNDKGESKLNVPDDAYLFAGSLVLLEPDTAYEIKLSLTDPDGGQAEKALQSRTRGEPVVAANAPQYHVVPGNGGGSGTASDPYKGLMAAQAKAKPGDVFLVHAGVYEGTFEVTKSGEPGQPIVWRGAGDGETI